MGTKSIETRISSALLEFSKKFGKNHPEGLLVELPLSREGIANYIGVARETVSRKLGTLQDEGIIKMLGNKKIIIVDRKALQESIE
jgi:CRP/FNR family transcriptional regulator